MTTLTRTPIEYQTTNDLSLEAMQAAFLAQMTDENLHEGDFDSIDEVLTEYTGEGLATIEEVQAEYAQGKEVLKRYACFMGARTTIPFIKGKPTDDKVNGAIAWYLTDSGYIAQSPAYRFIRFYARKSQETQP